MALRRLRRSLFRVSRVLSVRVHTRGYVARVGQRLLPEWRRSHRSRFLGTLVDQYEAAIQEKSLERDSTQLQLLHALEEFHTSLCDRKTSHDHGDTKQVGEAGDHLNGVYIFGGVGTGKSFCMDLFYDHATVTKRRWHFHEFMLSTHERLHKLKVKGGFEGNPLTVVAREISQETGQLLCFDEFQVTDIGDAMILKKLLETLFACGTSVVFTSNRPPGDLYLNGLNRHLFIPCIKMLEDTTRVVHLDHDKDYRSLKMSQTGACADVYISPASSPEARIAVQNCMVAYCNNRGLHHVTKDDLKPTMIDVSMGRKLKIDEAIDGYVAKFRFGDLCEQEKSAHDFLALAQSFQCIVLTEVPAMNNMLPDVLRRFITLIDALYEARNLVVISSDVSFETLTSVDVRPKAPQSTDDDVEVSIVGTGGSSGRSTTMIGNTEWSATGRRSASLAGLAGAAEAGFAKARAASRLEEMLSEGWVSANNSVGTR